MLCTWWIYSTWHARTYTWTGVCTRALHPTILILGQFVQHLPLSCASLPLWDRVSLEMLLLLEVLMLIVHHLKRERPYSLCPSHLLLLFSSPAVSPYACNRREREERYIQWMREGEETEHFKYIFAVSPLFSLSFTQPR